MKPASPHPRCQGYGDGENLWEAAAAGRVQQEQKRSVQFALSGEIPWSFKVLPITMGDFIKSLFKVQQ